VVESHDDFPGVEISIAGGVGEMVRDLVSAAIVMEYRIFDFTGHHFVNSVTIGNVLRCG